ncbi:MAG TPA: hypothetical protein VHD81_05140 [Mycobacteriales bacterium]|nr:hypothetical protein [Mycobacteriales bacterium]
MTAVVGAVALTSSGVTTASATPLLSSSRASAALTVAQHWLDAVRGPHPARAARYEAPHYKSYVDPSMMPRKKQFTRCSVEKGQGMNCLDFYGTYEVIEANMTRHDGEWKVFHVFWSSTD